jgi:hypothetical protein
MVTKRKYDDVLDVPTHLCATMVRRIDEGEPQALIIGYVADGSFSQGLSNTQYKWPAGTNKDQLSETPLVTRRREFREEAGLECPDSAVQLVHEVVIGNHTKFFYDVDFRDCAGVLRDKDLIEVGKDGKGGERLLKPRWLDFDLCMKMLAGFHLQAFAFEVLSLERRFPEWREVLSDKVLGWSIQTVSETLRRGAPNAEGRLHSLAASVNRLAAVRASLCESLPQSLLEWACSLRPISS